MRRTAVVLTAVVALVAAAAAAAATGAQRSADRAGPKGLKARTAIKKYERSVEQAEAAYRKALAGARKALLAELEQAKDVAFANRDEAEVRVVGDEIARLKLDLAAEATKPHPVVVDARQSWQRVAALKKGQRVRVRAEGSWVATGGDDTPPVGPDGWTAHGNRVHYREGKVGDGVPFLVGAALDFTAAESGTLYLRMADTRFDDNVGSVEARITAVAP